MESMCCISGGYPKLNTFQLSLKKKKSAIQAALLKADTPVFRENTWESISTVLW